MPALSSAQAQQTNTKQTERVQDRTDVELYNIRMRASRRQTGCGTGQEDTGADGRGEHISGAEHIVRAEDVPEFARELVIRAQQHSRGRPDFISIKVEAVPAERCLHLAALPVRTIVCTRPDEGLACACALLREAGVAAPEAALALLPAAAHLRGAMLVHADSHARLEPDQERGVRATSMGRAEVTAGCAQGKNHYQEALVLATKVAHAPGMVAEICISDDPDYVTGYVASPLLGYVRITCMKEAGSPEGGRIFFVRGSREELAQTVHYLEHQPVLVEHLPQLPGNAGSTTAVHQAAGESSAQGFTDVAAAGSGEGAAQGSAGCAAAGSAESAAQGITDGAAAGAREGAVRSDKWAFVRESLARMEAQGLTRTVRDMASAPGHVVRCADAAQRPLLLLASNDYLALAGDARVRERAARAALEWGTGSGGSRLTTGSLVLHSELERRLAAFKQTERALLFNTGYMANVGVLTALCGRGDVIFSDELNHASIIDGCRQSRAEVIVYAHNDMADLARKAAAQAGRRGIIVSDAVFSMDGDCVPLPELVAIADRYGFLSMIDEAHATGVLGPSGRGAAEHFHCRPDILVGTLSKALGSEGGFVCGRKELIACLTGRARSFIFSTALSAAPVAAALAALDILEAEPERVARLAENAAFFCRCLQDHGLAARTESAIVPLIVGKETLAVQAAARLYEQGILLSAIRYPSVARGSARLRATVRSDHSHEELARAAAAIAGVLRELA